MKLECLSTGRHPYSLVWSLLNSTKDRCQLDPTPAAAPASARYCQINACRAWLDTSWNYYLMYILICLFVSPQWRIFFFWLKLCSLKTLVMSPESHKMVRSDTLLKLPITNFIIVSLHPDLLLLILPKRINSKLCLNGLRTAHSYS